MRTQMFLLPVNEAEIGDLLIITPTYILDCRESEPIICSVVEKTIVNHNQTSLIISARAGIFETIPISNLVSFELLSWQTRKQLPILGKDIEINDVISESPFLFGSIISIIENYRDGIREIKIQIKQLEEGRILKTHFENMFLYYSDIIFFDNSAIPDSVRSRIVESSPVHADASRFSELLKILFSSSQSLSLSPDQCYCRMKLNRSGNRCFHSTTMGINGKAICEECLYKVASIGVYNDLESALEFFYPKTNVVLA